MPVEIPRSRAPPGMGKTKSNKHHAQSLAQPYSINHPDRNRSRSEYAFSGPPVPQAAYRFPDGYPRPGLLPPPVMPMGPPSLPNQTTHSYRYRDHDAPFQISEAPPFHTSEAPPFQPREAPFQTSIYPGIPYTSMPNLGNFHDMQMRSATPSDVSSLPATMPYGYGGMSQHRDTGRSEFSSSSSSLPSTTSYTTNSIMPHMSQGLTLNDIEELPSASSGKGLPSSSEQDLQALASQLYSILNDAVPSSNNAAPSSPSPSKSDVEMEEIPISKMDAKQRAEKVRSLMYGLEM